MLDAVFKALADASRRRLLDRLNARGGQSLHELVAGLGLTRQSVSRHLAVLEAAGLVRVVRHGREKRHHLDVAPLDAITERWLGRYGRVAVYTAYVGTTPERVRAALAELPGPRGEGVTFGIAPDRPGVVRLTVFRQGSAATGRWPEIVSRLKTRLEQSG